jgi:hypothetical protein
MPSSHGTVLLRDLKGERAIKKTSVNNFTDAGPEVQKHVGHLMAQAFNMALTKLATKKPQMLDFLKTKLATIDMYH